MRLCVNGKGEMYYKRASIDSGHSLSPSNGIQHNAGSDVYVIAAKVHGAQGLCQLSCVASHIEWKD